MKTVFIVGGSCDPVPPAVVLGVFLTRQEAVKCALRAIVLGKLGKLGRNPNDWITEVEVGKDEAINL
jgi:hypothetical protein